MVLSIITMYAYHNQHHVYAIAHQWISDLLGSDAVESPDHNQVRGEEVPGRFLRMRKRTMTVVNLVMWTHLT